MKRSARMFVADSEVMTPEILEKIQSGEDGLVIQVDTGGAPVDSFIKAIQDPKLNPQIGESLMKLREEIREIIGLDDFIRGNVGTNVTATQASLVSEGTNLRVEWRRSHLSDFIVNSLRKLWKIVQQHYDAEDIIPIVGDDGATVYQEFTPADLEGEFALDIAVNSTAPPNKQLEVKQALDRYNLLRPDPKVDSRKLIFDLLDAMRVPETDKFVKAPEETEQMSIQEETELLNQGQKALAHPGDDHEMHLAAHTPEMEKNQNTVNQLQQHNEEIQRLPDGPERQSQEQQMMGYQQEMQHLQTLAGVWQDHVQQHQKWRDSDMGVIASGGSARPGEPVNPNMFNRRDTRVADLLAENQGG